jgi:large subunit ribosomal protein L20
MPRAKRGNKRLQKRKDLQKLASGYRGTKSKLYRSMKESVERALKFAYVGRKLKKRDYRSLWIVRIGAAARANGLNYSQFMHGLKAADIHLDRKLLADLAVSDANAFAELVSLAKKAIESANGNSAPAPAPAKPAAPAAKPAPKPAAPVEAAAPTPKAPAPKAEAPAEPEAEETTSRKSDLNRISDLTEEHAAKLRVGDIHTCEQLLEEGASPAGRKEIAELAGADAKLVLRWINQADLFRLKGVETKYANLLEAAGRGYGAGTRAT